MINWLLRWALPELTPDEILPESGFHKDSLVEEKLLFMASIEQALRDPGWLMDPPLITYNGWRRYHSHQHVEEAGEFIRNLVETSDIARKLDQGLLYKEISHEGVKNIIVRALDLMSEKFPNLTLSRGTSYHWRRGYNGIDFSPAYLNQAIGFTKKDTIQKKRKNPVIVLLKYSDLVECYRRNIIDIGTEGDWSRLSIEVLVNSKSEFLPYVMIYRCPQDPYKVKDIIDAYEATAIKTS